LQRGDLIQEGEVAGAAAVGFLGQVGIGEESENTQPVVDGHQHHAFLGQRFAVRSGRRARAAVIAAGMNPDHHGPPV